MGVSRRAAHQRTSRRSIEISGRRANGVLFFSPSFDRSRASWRGVAAARREPIDRSSVEMP
jgi:hypothetical protein